MDPEEPIEEIEICTPLEESTITSNCKNCNIEVSMNSIKGSNVKRAIHCRWCDGWEESDCSDDDDDRVKTSFYCRSCTSKCWNCEVRGCRECVDVVCCDCCVSMCKDCAYTDILCGCYGKCYDCGKEVNRGSDGWPCGECEKWYCNRCIYADNDCKECNPREDESEKDESDKDESEKDESLYINEEENPSITSVENETN